MWAHIVQIAFLAGALILGTFLPFFPGTHDPLAMTVSGLCYWVGKVGLVFVPVGFAWLAFEMVRRGKSHSGFGFGAAALVVGFLAAGLTSLAAFAIGRFVWGALVLGFCIWALRRSWAAVRKLKTRSVPTINPAPLYLVFVPLIVFVAVWRFAERAAEFSRNRGIHQSARLIEQIEVYRETYGKYPENLAAEHHDYRPGVIGISHYEYARAGNGYNLYFESPVLIFGTREFVVYNPLDEHLLPSHDSDILLWTAQQLRERMGYYAAHDAPTRHWKYFWYD